MKIKVFLCVLALLGLTWPMARAQQVQVSSEFNTRSGFSSKHDTGSDMGNGDLVRLALKYNQHLSLSINEQYQPKTWALSLNASYASLDDKGLARRWNPEEILNAGATVTYLTPISTKWSIMASVGAGIFAQADHIRWQSVLLNGACIFVYKATPYLSVGGGAGLTNAYGPPMVMPMFFLSWRRGRKYLFEVNCVNAIQAKASTRFGSHFKLTWNILEMDNLMAVVYPENKAQIYSSMMLKMYLTPEYYVTPKLSIYGSAGVTFMRSSRISDRKIGAMFSNMGGGSRHFTPAALFMAGVRYGF